MAEQETGLVGITGASGHLGGRVLDLVIEHVGAARVVAITRSPEKLADVAAKGVEVRAGDFAQVDQLPAAFAGVERLYVISVDDATPGLRPRLHGNAINAAKQAGVNHLFYSSGVKPQHSPILFFRDHAATEQLVAESGLPFTFLRNNLYLEVLFQSGTQAIASGVVYSSAQGGAVGYVSREDCARAAAAVLTSSGHEGAIYDITGSFAWTQAEVASEFAKLAGRPIDYVPVSDAELMQGVLANGLPQQVAETIVGLDRGFRLGAVDVVSRAVAMLTGTPPMTLPEFLALHKDQFLAKPSA